METYMQQSCQLEEIFTPAAELKFDFSVYQEPTMVKMRRKLKVQEKMAQSTSTALTSCTAQDMRGSTSTCSALPENQLFIVHKRSKKLQTYLDQCVNELSQEHLDCQALTKKVIQKHDLLQTMEFKELNEVLSKQTIKKHNLHSNSKVATILGRDFDPKAFNYHGKMSTSKDFVMYLIVPYINKRKTIRLFECHHTHNGATCSKTLQGIKNFF